MSIASWFRNIAVTEAQVRAEIWSLGGRHGGRPLEGALEELKRPNLPAARIVLLRACVREMQSRSPPRFG